MPEKIKRIKNHDYLYFVYYENGTRYDVYCGLASKPESKRKFLKLELEYLKEQKDNLSDKVIHIESKLNKIG